VQVHNDYVTWLRDRGMPHHSTSHGIAGNGRVARPWTMSEELHHTSWVAEQGARWFDTARDPSSPWFMHLSFVAPHPPLIPPEAYWEQYIHRDDLLPAIAEWAPQGPARRGVAPDSAVGPFEREDIRRAIAGYYALITHIDDRIAYVLERFFEYHNPRAQEPTYILFSSDHGEMLGDHHLFRKSLPYESSAHVPLFITGRNVEVPTGTCDALCSWEDIMPTILELAGVPMEPGANARDGRSLVAAMRGGVGPRDAVDGVCTGSAPHRYVVAGQHKYVWFLRTNEEQLFDVSADPNELHDLSGNAGLLAPMRDRMAGIAGNAFDRAALRPCENKTPAALGFPKH
jgi:arylsulfatase A-like enzyme